MLGNPEQVSQMSTVDYDPGSYMFVLDDATIPKLTDPGGCCSVFVVGDPNPMLLVGAEKLSLRILGRN